MCRVPLPLPAPTIWISISICDLQLPFTHKGFAMVYCTDVDLLHWEPNIFRDALFASQLLLSGTGNLAGTTFTLASGSLVDAHVVPDEVIVLTGAVAGSFPVVSIDSATQLTLSVLHDG